MKTTKISNAEMTNIVALCATTNTKISLRNEDNSISAVIPDWGREYVSDFSKNTKHVMHAYIGVILAHKKKDA